MGKIPEHTELIRTIILAYKSPRIAQDTPPKREESPFALAVVIETVVLSLALGLKIPTLKIVSRSNLLEEKNINSFF